MTYSAIIPIQYQGQAQVEEAWAAYGGVLASIAERLGALPDDTEVSVRAEDDSEIGRVMADDAKRKFANISWLLATGGVSNGGVGAISSQFTEPGNLDSWLSATAALQVPGFLGYAEWDELGLHYLALHETAHVTRLGLRIWYSAWDEFTNDHHPLHDTYAHSEEWTFNEQAANAITRALGDWIGVESIPHPPEGFPAVRNHLGLMLA